MIEDSRHWRKPGYLVLSGSSWLLPAKDQITGTCYYEFASGRIVGEPDSGRFAIAHAWSLHLVDEQLGHSAHIYAWTGK